MSFTTAHGDEGCGWCDDCEAGIRADERASIMKWLRATDFNIVWEIGDTIADLIKRGDHHGAGK